MKQLDLLLLNPGGRKIAYQKLAEQATAIEPPVWCGLIAGFVRRKGYSAEVLDVNAEGLTDGEAARTTDLRNPRLVAIVCYGQNPNASTQTMPAAYALVRAIKEHNPALKVLMVGGHVAALPERTLRESGADYCATGEGCYTICDLLEMMTRLGDKAPLTNARGLCYSQDVGYGVLQICTKPAPNVNVEEMPFPVETFDYAKYRCHEWHGWTAKGGKRSPYAAIYTSLGCPYKCSFCCIQAPFKDGDRLGLMVRHGLQADKAPIIVQNEQHYGERNSYRLWSPETVVGWLDELLNHGVTNVKVADEMFVLNRRHVEGICDGIIARGWGDSLNMWAYGRVDTCNDEALLAKMRRAGFRWLALGIESASESVRDGVDKGYAQEKIAACVQRVKNAGIHVGANYIFGLPGDDMESMHATYDLACELNTPYANFYCTATYPGSQLWNEHPEVHGRGWETFAQFGYDFEPMNTKHVFGWRALKFRECAWQHYFKRPEYVQMMTREFGAEVAERAQQVGRKLRYRLLEGTTNGNMASVSTPAVSDVACCSELVVPGEP